MKKRAKRAEEAGVRAAARPARPRLAAEVDGKPLSDDEARAIWERFSAHMDAHQGDAVGFALGNGYTSATPEYRRGQAVLVLSTRRALSS